MTEEQAEQLKAIQQARELGILPWSHLSSPTQRFEIARDTLDFLLSLLTTQSQSSLSQLMTDEDECIAREQAALEAGEKRMRDKCVEKVREHARFFNSKGFARTASALFKAADDVELLTLEKNP